MSTVAIVACSECGTERHMIPSAARNIVAGRKPNRCRTCGNGHRRSAATPAPPPVETWRADAACLGSDLRTFFSGTRNARDALEICAGCRVRLQCLTEELSRGLADQWGIRGGTTPTERRAMLRAGVPGRLQDQVGSAELREPSDLEEEAT